MKTSPEAARREKPLVTLDLNLTFMRTPGSGSAPQARIGWYVLQTRKSLLLVRLTGNTEGTRDRYVTIGPLCNYQFDAFDSWSLHESEIQVQGNQRFCTSRRFASRLSLFAALSRLKRNLWDQGTILLVQRDCCVQIPHPFGSSS